MTTNTNSALALVDEILDIVASAQVGGIDPTDAFMAANEITPKPATALLVRKGIALLLKDKRADQRLEYKVLDLDPEFYVKIQQRLAEEDSQPHRKARLRYQEKKEQEREERMRPLIKQINAWSDKLNKAMEFYERWTLPDGTMLGDATRERLLAEAWRERSTSEGHLKNAVFYETLARDLKSGETVREGVPLDQAHRIRESVYAPAELVAA